MNASLDSFDLERFLRWTARIVCAGIILAGIAVIVTGV